MIVWVANIQLPNFPIIMMCYSAVIVMYKIITIINTTILIIYHLYFIQLHLIWFNRILSTFTKKKKRNKTYYSITR